MNEPYRLFNFRTNQYDDPNTLFTDENAADYMPQSAAAMALYREMRSKGKKPMRAIAEVLLANLANPSDKP